MADKFLPVCLKYVDDILTGKKIAGKEIVAACQRFRDDMNRDDIELRTHDPDLAINIMQTMLVHKKGETLDGDPLQGKPFMLEPFEIFIVFNLLGFYYKGTKIRRYKEAFIMLGRKNGKTSLVAGLAFATAIIQRRSGSACYIVANALKQSMEAFNFLKFSLEYKGVADTFDIKDNSFEHSIKYAFTDAEGNPDGTLELYAMPTNPDSQDSFNANLAICDEVAAYRKAAQYDRFKEAGKGYTNKLCVGITTAGDNVNSFGYHQMEYAIKVATGVVKDDSLFAFVARADQDEKGNVEYTDPTQHEKANPNYGVTIRPSDMMNDALQAQNNPQLRKDFLSRSLNIYTTAMRAYFDIGEFRRSDSNYNWTLDELAKLPISWYGGADLSRMHDLTATALFGRYEAENVDIIITHAFFPITQAAAKAEEDHIPLFGWQDDGWLTMCNSPTVNIGDIVNWFVKMREKGFDIQLVGHDRKFASEEYFPSMKEQGFNIKDIPQYYYLKSQGFRHIEKAAKDGRLYYLHSEAYEYCVSNVYGIEKTDDAIKYEKILPTQRIDLFDASVFATVCFINADQEQKKIGGWFG